MGQIWEDKWKLGERLGKGGQGVTHVATSVDGTEKGALKYLKNNSNVQARGRMKREVSNLQALASAGGNVPKVLDHNTDLFESDKSLYVVMELIEGKTLEDCIKERVLSIDETLHFARQVLETIEIAHRESILHRDLKPANIIVTPSDPPTITVVDYGLSFNTENEDLTETLESFQNKFLDLPETNTPSGDMRDPRSDLTAFCGLVFYCLTGQRPGQLLDASGKLPHKRTQSNLLDLLNYDPRSRQLDAFFTRGFSPDISNRFQNAKELGEQLKVAFTTLDPNNTTDPIKKAEILSEIFRQKDRKTQLAALRQYSGPLIPDLANLDVNYLNKLGIFTISKSSLMPQVPGNLEVLHRLGNSFQIQPQNHDVLAIRSYVVIAQEDSCILMASDMEGEQHRLAANIHWKEVARFQGDPKSVLDLVRDEFRNWVNLALDRLAKHILPK